MGNSCYMYLSIAFIQMLKSLGTVGVFGIGCIFGVEKFSVSTFANMVRHLPTVVHIMMSGAVCNCCDPERKRHHLIERASEITPQTTIVLYHESLSCIRK